LRYRRTLFFVKDLYHRFIDDDLLSVAAQATYYLLLSIFPFLIFLISLSSLTPYLNFQENIELIVALLPSDAYSTVQDIVKDVVANRSGTTLSFGMLIILWSSSLGVNALIRGINKSYDQQETRPFWKVIMVSIYFNLELAFVIVFSLTFIIFGKYVGDRFGLSLFIWHSIRHVIAFITINIIFISFYHNTPNRHLKFREVLPGSMAASLGWVLISVIFSYYANNLGNYSKVYGSLGGIFALMTWIYISSIMILLGAEINASICFSKSNIKKIKSLRF